MSPVIDDYWESRVLHYVPLGHEQTSWHRFLVIYKRHVVWYYGNVTCNKYRYSVADWLQGQLFQPIRATRLNTICADHTYQWNCLKYYNLVIWFQYESINQDKFKNRSEFKQWFTTFHADYKVINFWIWCWSLKSNTNSNPESEIITACKQG